MTDYNVVRGFAPMIREVVRTKRMPPWHADPHVGVFKDDRALTAEQAQTLVHWIEAGAPRGKGPDTLAEVQEDVVRVGVRQAGRWSSTCRPSTCRRRASSTISATRSTNPTGRDVWVRATDIIPGDRSVVHHVIVGVYDPRLPERERSYRASSPELGAYVPGNGASTLYPQDTGVLLPKDASRSRSRCTTRRPAKPAHDVTRFGLYFTKEPPKYVLRTARARELEDLDSGEHEGPYGVVHRTSVRRRTCCLSTDAARALPRHAHRTSSRSIRTARGAVVVGAEVRLQLADDVHPRRAED